MFDHYIDIKIFSYVLGTAQYVTLPEALTMSYLSSYN